MGIFRRLKRKRTVYPRGGQVKHPTATIVPPPSNYPAPVRRVARSKPWAS